MAAPRDDQSPLELELQRERAQAMSRAGDRLEAALRALADAEAALQARPTPEKAAARAEARAHAAERLWFLVVQREAIGQRDHRVLEEVWRIPPGLWSAMGPRRGGS